MQNHKLAFIGAGYVGLVSGACLADIGHTVVLADKNEDKVAALERGEIPIYEPGLEELVARNVKAGRLSFTTSVPEAVGASDIIFIAVNTPSNEDGEADLSFYDAATKDIAKSATEDKIVVNKSTVPPTTGKRVARQLDENSADDVSFQVVSNPEFLREGSSIEDFMKGDRVVIGVEDEEAERVMREIYEPLDMPLLVTDIESAELIKYASNSFLATKISFMNAVARIAERVGGNIEQIAEGMGADKRIGPHFLKAGIGYGGSCFPKDVSAFISIAGEHGYDFDLLKAVEQINENARKTIVDKLEDALGGLEGKTIALWGLAFKPNTDDMRSAPSITISNMLRERGAHVKAYDPKAETFAREAIGEDIEYAPDKYEALAGVDALAVVTEWEEFVDPDWKRVKSSLTEPVVVDGRNVYDPAAMRERGFTYYSIGR